MGEHRLHPDAHVRRARPLAERELMRKWEYLVVPIGGDHHDRQQRLNELGSAGWECFAFAAFVAYFKRPLE
jgi:hypothetical protein